MKTILFENTKNPEERNNNIVHKSIIKLKLNYIIKNDITAKTTQLGHNFNLMASTNISSVSTKTAIKKTL